MLPDQEDYSKKLRQFPIATQSLPGIKLKHLACGAGRAVNGNCVPMKNIHSSFSLLVKGVPIDLPGVSML